MAAALQITAALALLCVYQSAWLTDLSQVKVWEKSRRIGASWVEALFTVLEAAKKKSEGGQSTYYLSYNKDMTRQFINDCAWWAGLIGAAAGVVEEVVSDFDKDVTIFRITFASGFEICGMPSEPRSLRSKQGRVIIDEAAFVEDLGELIKAAMALLMWGGQVVILSTHNGADNPFNELIQDIHRDKFDYSLHRTDLDEALQGNLFKAICRRQGTGWTPEAEAEWRDKLIKQYGDAAEEELFCVPSRSGGVYLTTAMIEAVMLDDIPVYRWLPPAGDFVDWAEEKAALYTLAWCETNLKPHLGILPLDCDHYIGGDFGRTGDLTVFTPATETPKLDLLPPFVLELRNCPHRTQEQIFFYVCDHLPRFAGGALDARGNGSFLAETARQRYGPERIAEVMITEKWYRETTPKLKARIEDKTLFLPKDAHILADYRAFKVIRGVARIPDKKGKDATGQRHGDAGISGCMLIHARETFDGYEPWECVTASASEAAGTSGVIDWAGY
jgi:phage FluMu gp28-like protein